MVSRQPDAQFISVSLAEKLAIFDPDNQIAGAARALSSILDGYEETIVRAFWETYLSSLPADLRPTSSQVDAMIPQGIENTRSKFKDFASQDWADGACAYAALSATETMMSALRAGFVAGHCETVRIISEIPDFTMSERTRHTDTILKIMAVESDLIGSSIARLKDKQREAEHRKNARWFQEQFATIVSDATESGSKLSGQVEQAVSAANGTLTKTIEVAAAAEQSASAMHEAAAMAAGLVQAMVKTNEGVDRIAIIAAEAQSQSQEAVSVSTILTESMKAIESITEFVGTIARQTNLLALNATIEAARAGEHGNGFAIVAQEVKLLARQTADSIAQIRQQTSQVHDAVKKTFSANEMVLSTIQEVTTLTRDIKNLADVQAENVVSITAAIDETATTATTMSNAVSAIQQETEIVTNKLGLMTSGFSEASLTLEALQNAADTYVRGHGLPS